MNISIRRSTANDLDLLENIEKGAFPLFQQSTRRTLNLSLKSNFQEVWLAEVDTEQGREAVGCLIVHVHKKTLRIFSIGVLPEFQNTGVGYRLLRHAENIALSKGLERLSLEVDANNRNLIQWYLKAGYTSTQLIADYYSEGKDAIRLVYVLPTLLDKGKLTNLIVVDDPTEWKLDIENVVVMSSVDYTTNKGNIANKKVRVFNLCNSYRYQSLGYYVSLLASARDQRAIPNVTTIRDFKDVNLIRSIADDFDEMIQKTLSKCKTDALELKVYFGQTQEVAYKQLAQKLYQMFETPLFSVQFVLTSKWQIKKIRPVSLEKTAPNDFEMIKAFAKTYFETKRFQKSRLKNYNYYLAILVNPDEKNPPSNKAALKRFKEAAEALDVYPEFITKEDYNKLYEYDALFIRETTDVNNYTYQFSRKAYAEGLVVIDDPWSILRCSNKIFLNERLRNNEISTPLTYVLNKFSEKEGILKSLKYPMILKQPDSAFSIGVTKVNNLAEMKASLKELFKKSDLIIAQEFLPSEYDWRIGVLDNQPLFACQYFMAKDHWQIYNWKGKKKDQVGNSTTLVLDQVPPKIMDAALKAAALMGDGLYGVDLKMIGNKVYVIEVNDNPNIDVGVEDKIGGKKIYERIIKSFLTRIEMSRNIERFVSIEPD
ncbi:MAG: GNAT family N-acetyltransferase [Balneolaceae bacterium]